MLWKSFFVGYDDTFLYVSLVRIVVECILPSLKAQRIFLQGWETVAKSTQFL